MDRSAKPSIPIPEPLRGLDNGTWAQSTIQKRLPDIAQRVLDENELPQDAHNAISVLIAEIPHSDIRPINDPSASDQNIWHKYTKPFEDMDWLEVPWFFAEHYFYRRIIEGVGFLRSEDEIKLDPFSHQKHLGIVTNQDEIRSLSANLTSWLKPDYPVLSGLQHLLDAALWGNRADLSLWPVGKDDTTESSNSHEAASYLLINDVHLILERLGSTMGTSTTVDMLIDNAGFELMVDLCLTDFLLSRAVAKKVRLHVKAHPTFVSDATSEDVKRTLSFFLGSKDPDLATLGERLREHFAGERLVLSSDFFWTSPLSMWEMPQRLFHVFAESHLVISKGDANYRRLLGDRHWPFTSPFNEIMSYFPAPLLALRTLKAELASGLVATQIEDASSRDPHWMTNGRWGIIQFAGNGSA